MIPEIKLSLNYDIDRKKWNLVANVESIFDICYYSIARLLATNAPSEDPNTDNIAPTIWVSQFHFVKCVEGCI